MGPQLPRISSAEDDRERTQSRRSSRKRSGGFSERGGRVFKVGDRVRHTFRGAGVVSECMEDARTRVTFDNGEEHLYNSASMHKLCTLDAGTREQSSTGAESARDSRRREAMQRRASIVMAERELGTYSERNREGPGRQTFRDAGRSALLSRRLADECGTGARLSEQSVTAANAEPAEVAEAADAEEEEVRAGEAESREPDQNTDPRTSLMV